MKLYHLTTAPPLSATCIAQGSFTAPKRQEVVVGSSTHLHLYRRAKGGALIAVHSAPAFGSLRAVVAFRQPGLSHDYLAVTCDGGGVTLLRASARGFEVLAYQTFGRSGIRRTVPGQYLAADPHGRAILIAAVERSKLVYGIGRSENNDANVDEPVLFSALEAHRNACVFDVAALDVGYENPRFAVLEVPYDTSSKQIVHYELDLGLNTVLRRTAISVHNDAHKLFPCPDAGLLLCRPGFVEYHPEESNPIAVQIPTRTDDDCLRMITAGAIIKVKKSSGSWFYFLGNEVGDIFRVEVKDGSVTVAYFDTLPDVATHMCILKPGFLFAALQGGDTHYMRFLRSEPDGDDGCSTSTDGSMSKFNPHTEPRHLAEMTTLGGASQVRGISVGDFAGLGASQTVIAAGRGNSGVLQVRKRGMACEDRITPVPLSSKALSVWSMSFAERRYIAFTHDASTTVREVTEESLADVTVEIGVRADARSLLIGIVGSLLLQVHARGIRTCSASGTDKREWKPGSGVRILAAACNSAQCVVALSSGDAVYFEIDDTGALSPVDKIEDALRDADDDDVPPGTADPQAEVCIAIAQIRPGMKRAAVFAVGDAFGSRVALYRIDQRDVRRVAVHVAPAPVHSVALVDFAASEAPTQLCALFIGTTQGACVWLRVDYATGSLSERRAVFLGPRPVRVVATSLRPVQTCVFAGARPWLCYPRAGALRVSPLATSPFANCAPFLADDGPGLVAVQGSRLRMLALPAAEAIAEGAKLENGVEAPALVVRNTEEVLQSTQLTATPRRVVPVFSLQVGAGGFGEAPRLGATGVAPDITGVQSSAAPAEDRAGIDLFVVVEADHRSTAIVDGVAKPAGIGHWASQVRLVAISSDENIDEENADEAVDTLDVARLGAEECALCVTSTRTLGGAPDDPNVAHVVVGVSRRLRVNATGRKPKQSELVVENELWTYRVDRRERKLALMHKTRLEPGPQQVRALIGFRDYVVAAVGARVRLYQLGRKQLLRKGECAVGRSGLGAVCALAVAGGDRIFAADVAQSVVVLHYTHGTHGAPGRLGVIARDGVQRWLTCMTVVDYRTVACGDKFGNACVLRVPEDAEKEANVVKLHAECCIHIGDPVTAVSFDGAAIRYATAHGAHGALTPFETESEHEVIRRTQKYLALSGPLLVRRDHMSWRSSFYPMRHVIDGDLCEKVAGLAVEDRKGLEKEVARPVDDITRILDSLRWKIEAL